VTFSNNVSPAYPNERSATWRTVIGSSVPFDCPAL
jgi:hypothetical protein